MNWTSIWGADTYGKGGYVSVYACVEAYQENNYEVFLETITTFTEGELYTVNNIEFKVRIN